ncbi:unnamed protein product [Rotaria sp. Silwood2]|nr:unnamed protein product [Rotaria sp. Silwood2]CAF4516053.1 unnamed protein product [Rotaria sp. Silwood2]
MTSKKLFLLNYLYNFSAAKTKWSALVTAYFRKSRRGSIRKIDFPKLLKELYSSSFSIGSVSGGFRRAGVNPFNDQAMKEKVIRQRSSYDKSTINSSSTIDLLTSVINLTQIPAVDTSDDNNSSVAVNSASSSHRQRTFDIKETDESDSDESIDDEPSTHKTSTYNNTYDSSSDDDLSPAFNQNMSNSTNTPYRITRRMSPSTAARSIISSYSQDTNVSTPPALTKTNSRIRTQRKFGEVITTGNLLDELKQKSETKKAKLKHKEVPQSQRSSKKEN